MYSSNTNCNSNQSQANNIGSWSTGLYGCFSDVPNCCLTFWCPCVTFGQIAEIVDEGNTSCGASGALYALVAVVIGCPGLFSCSYRSKMRKKYNLPGSLCGDCLLHCCCEGCALCQEYRELKSRGFDMTIGEYGETEPWSEDGTDCSRRNGSLEPQVGEQRD